MDEFDDASSEQKDALSRALQKEREREKSERAKARKARSAKRKIEKLAKTLADAGDITPWESEFSESLTQRLTEYDSAFKDREKGGADEALSYAQKAILAQLSKKARAATSKTPSDGFAGRSSFKRKDKSFTPRIRQLGDDLEPEPPNPAPAKAAPAKPVNNGKLPHDSARPSSERPFLRLVKGGKDAP